LPFYNSIFIFYSFVAIAFIGYVLPWGQMSFWGATVITNLLSAFPCRKPATAVSLISG